MKKFMIMLCLGVMMPWVQAQETNEVQQLKQEMREMREYFEQVQKQDRELILELSRKVELLTGAKAPDTTQITTAPEPVGPPSRSSAQIDPSALGKTWSPTDPIRVGKGAAYADVSLVATFAAGGSTANDIEGGTQLGGHDPNQRGFTVQGVELNLQGAVDPYFRGNANILFSIDSGGESFVELEEAWLETVSLPGNLQVRAGQFLTEFGRVNTQHPHAWAFADAPLVTARFLGPDGLRNPGARISWLAPTPFYSELFLGIQNSHGPTASSFRSAAHTHGGEEPEGLPFGYRHPDNDRGVKSFGDLLFNPRYAMAFNLTDSQTLLLGASAAFGPNASGAFGSSDTQLYGLDVYWKWKALNAQAGFPFVSFQAEAMLRRYELGLFDWDENGNTVLDDGEVGSLNTPGTPAVLGRETVSDYGGYAQLLYGFRKGWVAGLRADYVAGETAGYERMNLTLDGEPLGRDPLRRERWRVSPNLTWYPTEFSKFRLQYNYDRRHDIGEDHSVWFQFEFLLGAHAAHKF
jgi:hypothetical protein